MALNSCRIYFATLHAMIFLIYFSVFFNFCLFIQSLTIPRVDSELKTCYITQGQQIKRKRSRRSHRQHRFDNSNKFETYGAITFFCFFSYHDDPLYLRLGIPAIPFYTRNPNSHSSYSLFLFCTFQALIGHTSPSGQMGLSSVFLVGLTF